MSVSVSLEAAFDALQRGAAAECEELCRRFQEERSEDPRCLNLLGLALVERGALEEARLALERAVALDPRQVIFRANLGEVLRLCGRLEDAEEQLNAVIAQDGEAAAALNSLGIVRFEKGRIDEAIELYRKALALVPSYAEALNNLGNALGAKGEAEAAQRAYEAAIAARPGYADAYLNLAAAQEDRNDLEAARESYRKVIAATPKNLGAYESLATLLMRSSRYEEALDVLDQALQLDETSQKSLVMVGQAQLRLHNYVAAEVAVRAALKEQPENPDAYLVLAQLLVELDQFAEAEELYKAALELRPEFPNCLTAYASLLKALGRIEEARDLLRRTIELRPRAYGAYTIIADTQGFTEDCALLAKMRDLLASAKDSEDSSLVPLYFALGKAHDDIGQFGQAFGFFTKGAKLKRSNVTYEEAETASFFEKIEGKIGPELLSEPRAFAGHPSAAPIFIVGMPRSGSTLVEQILSHHPEVHGAGETRALNLAIAALRQGEPALPPYPELTAAMNEEQAWSLAETYLGSVMQQAGGARFVTDKMLTNFFFVGLINLVFPNATIIHIRRHPLDTCLSIYSKLFRDEMGYTYDLAELGRFYQRYRHLMEHWSRVLPAGRLLEVSYEVLAENLERETRGLLKACGLDWHENCLTFHRSERPVKTASNVQIRKPLSLRSIGRWRNYEEQLAPLRGQLGEIVESYEQELEQVRSV